MNIVQHDVHKLSTTGSAKSYVWEQRTDFQEQRREQHEEQRRLTLGTALMRQPVLAQRTRKHPTGASPWGSRLSRGGGHGHSTVYTALCSCSGQGEPFTNPPRQPPVIGTPFSLLSHVVPSVMLRVSTVVYHCVNVHVGVGHPLKSGILGPGTAGQNQPATIALLLEQSVELNGLCMPRDACKKQLF